MQRVVVDTNIYIDWLNEGRHEGVLFQREAVKHLSAVVLMELLAGAFSIGTAGSFEISLFLSQEPTELLRPRFRSMKTPERCYDGFSVCAATLCLVPTGW